jgi:hypothetical protein
MYGVTTYGKVAYGGLQGVSGLSPVGQDIAQVTAALTLSPGTQAIASVRNVSIAQVAASLALAVGGQAIATTNISSVSQEAVTLTLTTGTQSVSAGTVISISISQVAAAMALASGTQGVASVRIVSISQQAVTLSLAVGTQAVAFVRIVSISQIGATLIIISPASSIGTSISQWTDYFTVEVQGYRKVTLNPELLNLVLINPTITLSRTRPVVRVKGLQPRVEIAKALLSPSLVINEKPASLLITETLVSRT